ARFLAPSNSRRAPSIDSAVVKHWPALNYEFLGPGFLPSRSKKRFFHSSRFPTAADFLRVLRGRRTLRTSPPPICARALHRRPDRTIRSLRHRTTHSTARWPRSVKDRRTPRTIRASAARDASIIHGSKDRSDDGVRTAV